MSDLLLDPEFWVGTGTVIFLAILVWKKVPAMIASSLDARAAVIAKELEDARKLREEAQRVLELYLKKQHEAEKEAESIVTDARAEAERYARESRATIELQIARRAKQAQDKIAQAEAQAVADVRALAADAAVAAAEKLIAERLNDTKSAALIRNSLAEIPGKLN
jgi:F-type H+-transporting ATPase subunit b